MSNETTSLATKRRTDQATFEGTRSGTTFAPLVDMQETANELMLFADVPGCRTEDVDLRYEDGELFLTGRVKPRQTSSNLLVEEYEVGDFYRAFTIHESIDAGKISAAIKNGVLTVHLPKIDAVRPKQITVKGG